MKIDYHERHFRTVTNSEGGDVDDRTHFHYRQQADVVWATYRGGSIALGTMVGVARSDGSLDMRYQHVTTAGDICTGRCLSQPEPLDDGRVRLRETWHWTDGRTGSCTSIVEQVPAVRF
jgi:hypothetical protein